VNSLRPGPGPLDPSQNGRHCPVKFLLDGGQTQIVTAKMFKKPIKIASSNPLGGKDAKKVGTLHF
jgi:hypothetical protein